jgi:hypothetical protein
MNNTGTVLNAKNYVQKMNFINRILSIFKPKPLSSPVNYGLSKYRKHFPDSFHPDVVLGPKDPLHYFLDALQTKSHIILDRGDYSNWKPDKKDTWLYINNAQAVSITALEGAINIPPLWLTDTNDLFIRGLRYTNPTATAVIKLTFCDSIVIDDLQITGMSGYSIRSVASSNCTIQNSLFADASKDVSADIGAVLIEGFGPKTDPYSFPGANNVICDCEFRNLTDAIGWTYNPDRIDIPSSVFDNNEVYVTEDYYTSNPYDPATNLACAEDGADIKCGSFSHRTPCIVTNNFFHGFRPTDQTCGGTGSSGQGIVIHRNAQNIVVQNNVIYNSSAGVAIKGNEKYEGEKVSRIKILNNIVTNTKFIPLNPSTADRNPTGRAFSLGTGPSRLRVARNYFSDGEIYTTRKAFLSTEEIAKRNTLGFQNKSIAIPTQRKSSLVKKHINVSY